MPPPPREWPLGFRIFTGLLGWIVPWVLRVLFWTCRITVLHPEKKRWMETHAVVGVLWHTNFIFHTWFFERHGYLVMSSWSKDGEMMVRVMRQMGYRHVRGSSSRGGAQALYQVVDRARRGTTIAIAADGPRGPFREAKVGAVLAASHAGIPVVAAGVYCVRAKRLRNWDRSAIPYPFSRIVVSFGDPIHVPPDLDPAQIEEWRKRVEDSLTGLEDEAEALGRRTSAR